MWGNVVCGSVYEIFSWKNQRLLYNAGGRGGKGGTFKRSAFIVNSSSLGCGCDPRVIFPLYPLLSIAW